MIYPGGRCPQESSNGGGRQVAAQAQEVTEPRPGPWKPLPASASSFPRAGRWMTGPVLGGAGVGGGRQHSLRGKRPGPHTPTASAGALAWPWAHLERALGMELQKVGQTPWVPQCVWGGGGTGARLWVRSCHLRLIVCKMGDPRPPSRP